MKYLIILFFIILIPAPALAYVGPGLGIGAIGTVLGFLLAIFLLLVSFVWYPVKRLIKFIKRKKKNDSK